MAHLQLKGLRTILDLPAGEELSNAQKLKDADIYAELLQCLDDKGNEADQSEVVEKQKMSLVHQRRPAFLLPRQVINDDHD